MTHHTQSVHRSENAIDSDESGKKATGIRYIDTQSGEHKEVYAKAVVLAPGAMESSRILLNSKPMHFIKRELTKLRFLT